MALTPRQRSRFRNLDWVHLRGRAEPVLVHEIKPEEMKVPIRNKR